MEPIVKVRLNPDGKPRSAAASAVFDHSPATVWAAVSNIETFATYIPMVARAQRSGDTVRFDLRFKIGFFSVGFSFQAHETHEEGKWLELRWIDGEPRDLRLRFDLEPVDDGRRCRVSGDGEFDPESLGWLTKYFLKHHPEIQFGIFPGVALSLIDALRKASDVVAKRSGGAS
jgi:ribosome-associated toxin RatA of RatAB toxin-antitoxin module